MENEERKDYHIYTYLNNLTLKEGKKNSNKYINRKNNRTDNVQGYMEIQLTDEEASRYDRNKTLTMITKYSNVLKKRTIYLPRELLLYAIEQNIYGDENEHG